MGGQPMTTGAHVPNSGAHTTDPVESSDEIGWRVDSSVSRRRFLRTGTMSAAAVGVLVSTPILPGLLQGLEADAPATEGAAAQAEGDMPALAGPIVAHVTNASTGELSLYVGEREVAYRDPILVQHILRAAGR